MGWAYGGNWDELSGAHMPEVLASLHNAMIERKHAFDTSNSSATVSADDYDGLDLHGSAFKTIRTNLQNDVKASANTFINTPYPTGVSLNSTPLEDWTGYDEWIDPDNVFDRRYWLQLKTAINSLRYFRMSGWDAAPFNSTSYYEAITGTTYTPPSACADTSDYCWSQLSTATLPPGQAAIYGALSVEPSVPKISPAPACTETTSAMIFSQVPTLGTKQYERFYIDTTAANFTGSVTFAGVDISAAGVHMLENRGLVSNASDTTVSPIPARQSACPFGGASIPYSTCGYLTMKIGSYTALPATSSAPGQYGSWWDIYDAITIKG